MTSQRIKGQETSLILTRGGALEDTLTDIQNFNAELEFEIKSQGYLGEKTNRKDYVFNGTKFDMELHLHAQDWFKYQKAMIDKAKRNTPDVIFNITSVFNFPNGDTPVVLLNDVSFNPNPLSISSRGDYVKVKLQGECSDIDVQLS